MDDDVERLERAHRQAPTPENAARLVTALLRLGRRDELRARLKQGFGCDQAWWRLRPSAQGPGVRLCHACKRTVYLVETYADVARAAAAGHCAAVPPHQLPLVLDALIDAPDRGLARGPGEPCLLEGEEPRLLPLLR